MRLFDKRMALIGLVGVTLSLLGEVICEITTNFAGGVCVCQIAALEGLVKKYLIDLFREILVLR